ncbi:hypothetical protein KL923_005074 [Ogataea haglerorum]|nr:hypothetical protein KL923_005074 [Ogataea haglerorum]
MLEQSSSYTDMIYKDSSSMAFRVLLILKNRMPPSLEGSVPWLPSSPERGPDTGCESGAPAGPAWPISSWRCSRWVLYILRTPLPQARKNTISRHATAAQDMPSMDAPTLADMPASENLFLTITETAAETGKHQGNQNKWERESREVVVGVSIGDKVVGQRGRVSEVVVRRNRLGGAQACAFSVGVRIVSGWVANSPEGPSGDVSVGVEVAGSGLDPVEAVERGRRDRAGEDDEQQQQRCARQQHHGEQSDERSAQQRN